MRGRWLCWGVVATLLGSTLADPEKPSSKRWREDHTARALHGEVSSMLALGDRYLLEGDKSLARKWYRDAADLQVKEGVWKLIGIEELRPLKERAETMASLYHELIVLGEPRGYFRLGRLHAWPKSPLRDALKGRMYLEDAARLGVVEAKLLLGKLFMGQWEHPQNFLRAIDWLKQAASKNNGEAHRHLGMMYRFGMGAKQDLEEAWRHYSLAAKLHDAEAMFVIAEALYVGEDIRKDTPKAHRYYLDAANLGHLKAKDRLSELSFE